MANGRRTQRIGYGVQGQDGAEGTVRVLLVFHKQGGVPVSFVFLHGDIGDGRGHKYRLQQRAKERDGHCQEKVDN